MEQFWDFVKQVNGDRRVIDLLLFKYNSIIHPKENERRNDEIILRTPYSNPTAENERTII